MGDLEKTADSWFGKLQKRVSGIISSFVAYSFFLVALGAFIATIVVTQWPQHAFWAIAIPAFAGLLSYYNRAFAAIAFIALLILMFLI